MYTPDIHNLCEYIYCNTTHGNVLAWVVSALSKGLRLGILVSFTWSTSIYTYFCNFLHVLLCSRFYSIGNFSVKSTLEVRSVQSPYYRYYRELILGTWYWVYFYIVYGYVLNGTPESKRNKILSVGLFKLPTILGKLSQENNYEL